jgi:secreted trypsin-like serine protease
MVRAVALGPRGRHQDAAVPRDICPKAQDRSATHVGALMPLRIALLAAVTAALALPSPADAIVGGQDASRDYPYMVALTEADGAWAGCGASLIRSDWVLTAAHCVVDTKPADLAVRVGTQDISGSAGELVPAADIIVHERYQDTANESGSSYDVALVKLARPATRGTPIRLATPSESALWAAGTPAIVTGWGGTFYPGVGGLNTTEEQLMEVEVPMVSDAECATSVYGFGDASDVLFGELDPTTMVCAGEQLGGADSCSGDSGGPLVVADAAGALVQVGTVSFGFGCGYPLAYGVYGRVADTTLYSWIQGKLPAPAAAAAPAGAPAPAASAPASAPAPAAAAPAPAAAPRPATAASKAKAKAKAKKSRARARKLTRAQKRCLVRAKKVRGKARRLAAQRRCVRAVKTRRR